MCVCVYLFIKLHITAQSGLVILVILCHSRSSSEGGINDTCYVCVCVFIKLHITAQSGPVIYSFYATVCNPPGGYLARNARAHSYNSSPRYDRSRPEP